jgi:hypothetical protein
VVVKVSAEKIAEQFARWWWVAAVALIVLGGVAALVFIRPAPVAGVATANHDAVVAVQVERAAAVAQQVAAQEAADLAQLEDLTLRSMQGYFSDPANGLDDEGLAVLSVGLIKTGDNAYEGMATMTRNGGSPHDIPIHVTADDRTSLWKTDPGALMPLFG